MGGGPDVGGSKGKVGSGREVREGGKRRREWMGEGKEGRGLGGWKEEGRERLGGVCVGGGLRGGQKMWRSSGRANSRVD